MPILRASAIEYPTFDTQVANLFVCKVPLDTQFIRFASEFIKIAPIPYLFVTQLPSDGLNWLYVVLCGTGDGFDDLSGR